MSDMWAEWERTDVRIDALRKEVRAFAEQVESEGVFFDEIRGLLFRLSIDLECIRGKIDEVTSCHRMIFEGVTQATTVKEILANRKSRIQDSC